MPCLLPVIDGISKPLLLKTGISHVVVKRSAVKTGIQDLIVIALGRLIVPLLIFRVALGKKLFLIILAGQGIQIPRKQERQE